MAYSERTGTALTPVSRLSDTIMDGSALMVRWFLMLLVLILPLDVYLVVPPQQPVAFLSQILAVEGVVILLLVVLMARLSKVAPPFNLSWGDVLPLGVVLLIALLSIAGAANRSVAAKGSLKIVVYLCLYLLARAVRAGKGIRAVALAILLIGGVIVFITGYVSIVPDVPDVVGMVLNIHRTAASLPGTTVVRAEATFRYPNELAAYLLLVLPILLAFIVKAPTRTERISFALLGAMGFGLLFLTYTRGALLALLVAVPLVCYLLGGRRVFVAGSAILLALTAALLLGTGTASHRYLTVLSLADSGYTARFATWNWAFNAFLSHPFLGVGVDNLRFQPHAPTIDAAQGLHAVDAENLYLNLLAELGVAGFIPVVLMLGGAVRRAWRGLQANWGWLDQGWNAGVIGAITACLIYGLVDPVLVSGQITGLLCVLIGLAGPLTEHGMGWNTEISHSTEDPAVAAVGEALRSQAFSTGNQGLLTSRIVFLVNSTAFGGAEQHSITLAETLRQRGARVLVVCPPTAQYIPQLTAKQIPYRTMALGMNAGRWRGLLGTLALLNPVSRLRLRHHIKALAAEAPTIFVCPFPREQILVTNVSREQAIHSVWVLHAPLHYLPHRLIVRPLLARLAPRADAIVAIAPSLAKQYIELGFPKQRITVIPNMVAAPSMSETARTGNYRHTIGVASRLTHSKGVQFLIAAMPAILQRHPSAELWIAGSGRYASALRRQVRRLGLRDSVRFMGYVDMTEQFYRDLTVFVCPSADPGEGLPTVILEAMRAGTPVVATAVGGVADLLLDEHAGKLVSPASPQALAQAVVTLLDDPVRAEALGIEGRRVIQQQHTADRVAENFLQLLVMVERKRSGVALEGNISAEVRAVRGKHLLADTSMLLASKVITALVTALWTVLAARTLLPSVYGDLMVCAGLVELGAVITDAGLTAVATRELSEASQRSIRRLIGTLIYLKFGLGLVAMAVTTGVALLLPLDGTVHRLMLLMGASLIFVSLSSLSLIFRARMAIGYVVGTAFFGALVGVYGTIFVYWIAPTALRFAAARLAMVGAAGLMTLAVILYKYRPSLAFDWGIARKFLVSSLLLGVALTLNILYYRLDVPLVALLTNGTQVAIYVSAYRILDVVTLLPAAAASVALPLMVAARRDSIRHLATFCRQYLELSVSCGLLITVLLTIFGAPLLAILYGGRYDTSRPTLQVLAWVAAATLVTNVFMPLMVVLERQRMVLLATALGLAANVSLNFLLIPQLGAIAAAYATLATELVVTAPLIAVAVKMTHMRLVSRPIVAAFLATGAALLAYFATRGVPVDSWIGGAIALVVWGCVLFIIAPRWVMNHIETLRSRRSLGIRSVLVAAKPSTSTHSGEIL